MAPVSVVSQQQNGLTKVKRSAPPGIQTNGEVIAKSSPSPSLSHKKAPLSARATPSSASDRNVTPSTVRPINRARREASVVLGRNSRNSAGLRSGSISGEMASSGHSAPPYVVTQKYILRKHSGSQPSLVIHVHPTHFRFDGQDGIFPHKSPMGMFLEHLRTRTIPHDLIEYLTQANVPFYDGCLIVQVHDHKSAAQSKKETARPTSASTSDVPSSIHNYNPWLTPSPFVPFPKDEQSQNGVETKKEEDPTDNAVNGLEDIKSAIEEAPANQAVKPPVKSKVFTVVLHPTQESFQMDLYLKATEKAVVETKASQDIPAMGPPSTPLTLIPPTPTASSMPPPAKRQKREKPILDAMNMRATEGEILLNTNAPLYLEPTKNAAQTIALLELFSHPQHAHSPPQPKTRKRTVAEMAADEAAAADQERYMLVLDERLSSSSTNVQGSSGADGDAQASGATFEPRFERFKVIADIKREHAEKKEQDRIKALENERRLQLQKQQQHQEQLIATQRQQAEAERVRREAASAARENQIRQQAESQQRAMAARAAQTANSQNSNAVNNVGQQQPQQQPQQAHPVQNSMMPGGMVNGVPQTVMQNGLTGQAQQRLQAQLSQGQASSPIIRQGTPQNMSSPMVGGAPMQATNSAMAGSPPRPSSIVQNQAMSVPMAQNMSARGSQQSHQSGTPHMPNATPNMAHGTPVNRQGITSTPRMGQASPPPAMMAQGSQMGQGMVLNQQGMAPNPHQMAQQIALQQRLAQQQQQQQQMNALQNAGMGGMNVQMSPQQQSQQHQQMQQMMQRQIMLAQHQQRNGPMNPQQQQQFAQYTQQLQNMQNSNYRQMPPQMQAQIQQHIARMSQVNPMGNNQTNRQMPPQMMNGNNNQNMQQVLAALQQQQLQQQQLQQQQQQQMQQHQAQQQQAQQQQAQQQQAQQQQAQQQQAQQQQVQQQQVQQQQQQQQGQQQQVQNSQHAMQQQMLQGQARQFFAQLMQNAVTKYGGQGNIPAEVLQRMKENAFQRANQTMSSSFAQRRAMVHMMQQAQQQQQLQQQQQMQQQGMGGMMGNQGM